MIEHAPSLGPDTAGIGTEPHPCCLLCHREGVLAYAGLEDRLFDVPGQWTVKQCPDSTCGLLWLDPMPRSSELGKLYAGYYTHLDGVARDDLLRRLFVVIRNGYLRARYGYTQGVGPPWYRFLAPLVYLHPGGAAAAQSDAMFLPAPPPGARVLDIGAGSGARLIRMQQLGWQVDGLDADPHAAERAQAKGLPVRVGSLGSATYPPASFDAIYMNHVIEHVHDPVDLLSQAFRLLKPRGILIVVTPNSESWSHRHFGRNWRGLEPPRHLFLFSATNVSRLAQGKSGAVTRVRSTARGGRYFSSASQALRASPDLQNFRFAGIRRETTALAHQLFDRALHVLHPGSGDEVVMTVEKSSDMAAPPTEA